MAVKVIDVPEARRYEAQVDGTPEVAGFAEPSRLCRPARGAMVCVVVPGS